MTITKDEMTEYEFSTEMRDRLHRAQTELMDTLNLNKGYFDDDEGFKDALYNLNGKLTKLIERIDKEIGINYRRLTE